MAGLREKIRFILLVFGIAVLLVSTVLYSLNGMLIGFTLVGLSFLFALLSYGVMRSKLARALENIIHDIELGDPKFDKEFLLKGNKESETKTIMDQSIRDKIANIWHFYEVEIGHPYIEPLERKEGSSIARSLDAQPLATVKLDARRFRLIVDTMIDIVEKIEANTTSI